jgi:hypothetical protein
MSDLTDAYDHLEQSLRRACEGMLSALRDDCPSLAVTMGRTSNDAFPFRFYASFRRGGPSSDEDAVVSVDVKRRPSHLSFEMDISAGNGEIWVEGSALHLPTDAPHAQASIRSWVEGVVSLLAASTPRVSDEIAATKSE